MNRLGTIGKVLQLKENREEEIECEVRALRNAVDAHRTRLGILEKSYMETLESFNRKQREGRLAPHEMGIYYSYFFHLGNEMEAKKAAGYYTEGKVLDAAELAAVRGRDLDG